MLPYIFLSSAMLYSVAGGPFWTFFYILSLIGVWLVYGGLLVSVTLGRNELSQDVMDYGVSIPTTILYTFFFLPGLTAAGGIKWFSLFVYATYFIASYLLAVCSHGKASKI